MVWGVRPCRGLHRNGVGVAMVVREHDDGLVVAPYEVAVAGDGVTGV